ncbi:MAG: amidohydrolase family protein, partial [Plesiomonas shigelloides]
ITSAGSCAFASPADAVLYALEAGAAPERITVSSDGNGSLPVFNAQGEMERITAADVSGNLDLLVELVRRDVPITTALRLMTSNVADSLGLRKGRLATGEDADVCLFNPDFSLDTLIAGGQVLLQHGEMQVTANFE